MAKPSQLLTIFLWMAAFGMCLGLAIVTWDGVFSGFLVPLTFFTCGGTIGAIFGRQWQGLVLGEITFIVVYGVLSAMVYFTYRN